MKFPTPPPKKGQLKCNVCRKITPPKNGDWCIAKDSPNQQVFLCKACEAEAKSTFRRAVLPNPKRP